MGGFLLKNASHYNTLTTQAYCAYKCINRLYKKKIFKQRRVLLRQFIKLYTYVLK